MARVINLKWGSDQQFVYEEEMEGQWYTVPGPAPIQATVVPGGIFPRRGLYMVPPAEVARLTALTAASERSLEALREKQTRNPPVPIGGEKIAPGAGQIHAVDYAPAAPPKPPYTAPPPRVTGAIPRQSKLELTPAAMGALRALEAEREKQITQYISTPLGYVWQQSKKLPDVLTKIPIPRPPPSPGVIEEMFPRIRVPEAFAAAPQPPEPVRIFKGWLQVEARPRINVWEDAAGNEVEGYRDVSGVFGQVFPQQPEY